MEVQTIAPALLLACWVIGATALFFAFFSALPAILGVPGSFRVFAPSAVVLALAAYSGKALDDYLAPAEIKILKAQEDALRARNEAADEKRSREKNEAARLGDLEQRRAKLANDLEWERLQKDYHSPGGKERYDERMRPEWEAREAKIQEIRDEEAARLAEHNAQLRAVYGSKAPQSIKE